MVKIPPDLVVRPPINDDVQIVFELITICDTAEYGVSDSTLGDLMDEWSGIHLGQDAWLVFAPEDVLVGYAAVFEEGDHFVFDFFTHPKFDVGELAAYLLELCEAHAKELLLFGGVETHGTARLIIPNVNEADRKMIQSAGYTIHKYYFRMQIELIEPPVEPSWPKDFMIRTIHPGKDDQIVYEFVKSAFQRSGRTFPSFDRWKGYMMREDHFDSDLWFLLFNGNELTGVALCYDYFEHGWVRQLGVAESWRRMGIGSALLRHVFSVFYNRGHRKVALGVDSERSNAYKLYEDVGMQRVRQYDEFEKVFEVRDNGEN